MRQLVSSVELLGDVGINSPSCTILDTFVASKLIDVLFDTCGELAARIISFTLTDASHDGQPCLSIPDLKALQNTSLGQWRGFYILCCFSLFDVVDNTSPNDIIYASNANKLFDVSLSAVVQGASGTSIRLTFAYTCYNGVLCLPILNVCALQKFGLGQRLLDVRIIR